MSENLRCLLARRLTSTFENRFSDTLLGEEIMIKKLVLTSALNGEGPTSGGRGQWCFFARYGIFFSKCTQAIDFPRSTMLGYISMGQHDFAHLSPSLECCKRS